MISGSLYFTQQTNFGHTTNFTSLGLTATSSYSQLRNKVKTHRISMANMRSTRVNENTKPADCQFFKIWYENI